MRKMTVLYWTLFIVAGFLLGSILFCKIIPRRLLHKDICEVSDDHNPGAFNAIKHCGKKIGVLCLLLDVLKGFLPVLFASIFLGADSFLFSLVMVAPVLGHAVGLFNRFHGGKCIAVSFGVMLGILPITWIGIVILAALYIFFSTVAKISPNSKRSIVVYSLFGAAANIVLLICGMPSVAVGCFVIAVIAVVKHMKGVIPKPYHSILHS